ncbi:MAG: sulfite exporter TauE/SafE family protein [Oscillospiraceae bacterium]|nr:sulfite exporter TauE/SafE family protein [Oscillospiraceae bacterium]
MPIALTPKMVIIVAVGIFLAAFIDGISGGGGIIAIPTYLIAGLPPHLALGTNKLSSVLGKAVSTGRFIRRGYVDWKLGLPAIALAIIGAHLGTRLQLAIDERYLKWLLLLVLPIVAFAVLRQKELPEEPGEMPPGRRAAIVWAAAFVLGAYDGFYGPGVGTFLLLIFCNLAKMDVRTAAGTVKLVNFAANIGAVVTSFAAGKVFIALGLIAGAASVTGHYFGSGLAIRDGSKIVRPVVLIVLVALAIKVITELM